MASIGPDSMPERIATYRARIETVLDGYLPPLERVPERLHAALRYSALGTGKRLRPILVYATGEALGVPLERLDAPAAAVELIHAYSLVHDDLPAMDNDDLRRGRPTCHRAFDEGTAILAGDALQVLAFRILAAEATRDGQIPAYTRMIHLLAEASGTDGMAGGQALDLAAVGQQLTVEAARATVFGRTPQDRQQIAVKSVDAAIDSYPLLRRDRVKVDVTDAPEDQGIYQVTIVYDAKDIGFWSLERFVPMPPSTIRHSSTVRRGGR